MLGLAVLALAAPPPADLVDRLGAPAFAAREQAGRELAGYGPDALPALGAARAHPDPEVRRRAADLHARLTRLADDAARVAAAPVRLDYAGVPLRRAVADLRGRTGVPLVLGPGVADPGRPVTARTAELPPWQAVEAFLLAAGLHEEVSAEVPVGPTGEASVRLRRGLGVGPYHPESAALLPVRLADGYRPTPGDRAGGVRVQAVPAGFPGQHLVRGAGVTHLLLDVCPLPVLAGGGRWEDVTGVRLLRAEDDRGRPVPAAHRDPADPDPLPQAVVAFGGMLRPGLLSLAETLPAASTRPNPRLVALPVRTGDSPADRLRLLEGVITGEVTVPNQPLVGIADLPRAVRAGPVGGDLRLAVLGYDLDPAGRVTVRVRVEAPNPWTFPRLARGPNPGLPGLGPALFGPAGNPLSAYRFSDAAGRPVSPTGAVPGTPGDDGFRQSSELVFRFDPRAGVGPPATLVLLGERTVPVEVPFRLRDVPLP